jgi:hypothetical protein
MQEAIVRIIRNHRLERLRYERRLYLCTCSRLPAGHEPIDSSRLEVLSAHPPDQLRLPIDDVWEQPRLVLTRDERTEFVTGARDVDRRPDDRVEA